MTITKHPTAFDAEAYLHDLDTPDEPTAYIAKYPGGEYRREAYRVELFADRPVWNHRTGADIASNYVGTTIELGEITHHPEPDVVGVLRGLFRNFGELHGGLK
jgi:hypothetical protein